MMKTSAASSALVASDAFWSDDAPVALADGTAAAPVLPEGVPPHHVLFATSGSGGAPKWIALSKSALLASAAAVNRHLGVTSASVWGLALPVHHVGGFGVMARAREAGCAVEMFPPSWDPHGFATWLATRRVTHTSLVPTQVHDLVAAGCRPPAGLVVVVVGGGRLDVAAGRAARALGWPVLASYGMTEAASQVATQALADLSRPYVPAPIPILPHWNVRSDAGGCLEIAGPALFSGMIINGCYQMRPGDWHATRDRIAITGAGLAPLGRADDMVKIAGALVDPRQVESGLAAMLGDHGRSIAVVPLPDARLGHRLVVVAESSVPEQPLQAAIGAHNASVPRSRRIAAPIRLASLPRGALGKIQGERLREMMAEPL